MQIRIILLAFLCALSNLLSGSAVNNKTLLLLFSKNRPMQLEACLRSIMRHVSDINSYAIIYCADTLYQTAYNTLIHRYANCTFYKQETGGFKQLIEQILRTTDHSYIVFAVDDLIIKDKININYCKKMLEQTDAYGFYLRLGTNITRSYMEQKETGVPLLCQVNSNVFSWQFKTGTGDWAYPHSVDFTLYRIDDIKDTILSLDYADPNGLEGLWALKADLDKFGLCFKISKVVNLPLNLVRNFVASSNYLDQEKVAEYTPVKLLEKFNQRFMFDIDPLYKIYNNSPHIDYVPEFIKL